MGDATRDAAGFGEKFRAQEPCYSRGLFGKALKTLCFGKDKTITVTLLTGKLAPVADFPAKYRTVRLLPA